MNPLLYIPWQPDEYLLRIGSGGVRWYGLCWAMGLAGGYLLMQWLYKRHKYPLEKFEPLFLYVFVSIIIGARLGHCLFYEPDYYFSSFQHIIEIVLPIRYVSGWEWKYVGLQGLASHGGVAGLLIGVWMYISRSGMKPWVVLDFFGLCSCITGAFIRLGNLMNSEIIGKVTDVPWAFIFYDVDTYPRHPGQLYEALAYTVFFFLIFAIYLKRPEKVGTGLYFGLCVSSVFIFRFFIEYTKEIQVAFEAGLPFDMGQLLSLPLIAFGLYSVFRSRGKIEPESKI